MKSKIPHFCVPLNLPHAATIAGRILYHTNRVMSVGPMPEPVLALLEVLEPYRGLEDNPPKEQIGEVVESAAKHARAIVDVIERKGVGDDRLGQAVRNLFECLELGEEGAMISLRAGEKPDS